MTRKVKAKAKAKAASKIKPPAAPDLIRTPLTASEQQALSLTCLSSSYTLAPTIEERSIGYFFTTYVLGVDGPWDHFLNDNTLASMKALGLAGFSNAAHAPKLMIEAREQYLRAIRLTNTALRSPADVKKDSTLLAVVILGMFETVTGRNRRSLEAWASHVKGASALLKLRGPEQMMTPGGRRMFGQVTTSLVTACLQNQLELPEYILELRDEAAKYQPPNDPVWLFYEFMVQFTKFKGQVDHRKITDPSVILARALELDEMSLHICSNVPPGWEYKTIYTDQDPDIIYAGYYHVYGNFGFAQIWNGIRTFRILLHEIIQNILLGKYSPLPQTQDEQDCAAQSHDSSVPTNQFPADVIHRSLQAMFPGIALLSLPSFGSQ